RSGRPALREGRGRCPAVPAPPVAMSRPRVERQCLPLAVWRPARHSVRWRSLMSYLVVFLGAGFGGALRHGVNVAALRAFGVGFPVGTLAVNIAGSLLMGMLAGYFAHRGPVSQEMRLFLATGVLGGFTTFSAFSLDALLLWERGRPAAAAAYVAGSVLLSVAALALGLMVMRRLA